MIPEVKSTKNDILVNFEKVPTDKYYDAIVDSFNYISSKYKNIKSIKFENCKDVNKMIYSLCQMLLDVRSGSKEVGFSFGKIFNLPRRFFINDVVQYSNYSKVSSINFHSSNPRYASTTYFIDSDLKYFNYKTASKILDLMKYYDMPNVFFMVYYGNDDEGIFFGSNYKEHLFLFNGANVNVLKKEFPLVVSAINSNEKLKSILDTINDLNIIGALSIDIENSEVELDNVILYNENLAVNPKSIFAVTDYFWRKDNEDSFNVLDNNFRTFKFININKVNDIDQNGRFLLSNIDFLNIVKPSGFSLKNALDTAFSFSKPGKNIDPASIDIFYNIISEKSSKLFYDVYNWEMRKDEDSLAFMPLKSGIVLFDIFYNELKIDNFDMVYSKPILKLIKEYLANDKDVVFCFDSWFNTDFDREKGIPLAFMFLGDNLCLRGNLKRGIFISNNALEASFARIRIGNKNIMTFFKWLSEFFVNFSDQKPVFHILC